MTTEQTGRVSIDTTGSLTPIDLSTPILIQPSGGEPPPLPQTRAADGTRKLKSLPPPIPARASTADLIAQPRTTTAELLAPIGGAPLAGGTDTKLRAAPPRATLPPPIPRTTTDSASAPAIARTKTRLPAPRRAHGTVPPPTPARPLTADPDGWSVSPPADDQTPLPPPAPSDEHDEGLRDIMAPDPEGPDMTNPTPFVEPAATAPLDARPSADWLAKIDSVMRPEANPPVLFSTGSELPTTKAAMELFATKAEAPSMTQPLELVDLDEVPSAAAAPVAPALPSVVVAQPVVAPPAPLPVVAQPAPLPVVQPLPPLPQPRAPLPAPHPAAAVAASIGAAPKVNNVPPPRTRAPSAPPAPLPAPAPWRASTSGPFPVAAEAISLPAYEQSFDVDMDAADMTSAHTTNFEMPAKQQFISKRMALAVFAGVALLTVVYLGTRGGHSKPTTTPAAQTAQTETTAPVAAPAATVAPAAAPVAAPAAAADQAPAPAPAAQNIAAPAPAAQEVAAAPAPTADTPNLVRMPVTSKPSGALVTFVDGGHAVVVGRTPTTISFDPHQAHDVALTLLDHETQLVTIPSGGMTALVVDMGEAKTTGASANVPHVASKAQPQVATDVTAMRPETPAPKHHAAPAPAPAPVAPKAPPAHKVAQPAPHMVETPAPAGAGMLMISSKPPCEIVVDGKSTHLTTPQKALPLSAGAHTIVLVNAAQNVHKTLGVMITAKKSTKVIQDFTKH